LVTAIVYATGPPGSIRLAVVDFSIVTWGWSGTTTTELHTGGPGASGGQLLPGDVTVAPFATAPSSSTPAAGNGFAAWTTMLTVTGLPAPIVANVQVIVTPSAESQAVLSLDTNVSPGGSVSVTVTPVAAVGVSLATVIS
jgi:hypothetical protein